MEDIKLLTAEKTNLEEELERFRMWAEVTRRTYGDEWNSGVNVSGNEENSHRIRDL